MAGDHAELIVTGIVRYSLGLVSPAEEAVMTANSAEIAADSLFILILKAFASGCTALTGVEAVSNGVLNFREPAPKHAKKVLLIFLFILIMRSIKRHYDRVREDLALPSAESALAELNRDKTARVIIPVQSLNKSFIKTLNCALSCGFSSMELYSVCSTPEQAENLRKQVEALGVDCEFRYNITTLRNTSEVLLNHIRQEADARENERLIVMMGGLVVTSPFARILHNSLTHRLIRKMETYRNVYVFSVPYVVE